MSGSGQPERPLTQHPLVRGGVYAWALLGMILLVWGASRALTVLSVLVIPLLLALFPAALLAPPTDWLKRHRFPPALAALTVLVGFFTLLAGLGGALTPQIARELPEIIEATREGVGQLERLVETGPLDQDTIDDFVDRVRDAFEGEQAQRVVLGAAVAIVEGVVGLIFLFVALFFYLKDGQRIALWARDVLPPSTRADAHAMGVKAWQSIGSYFRGQLIVAFVDAVFIGLGLWLLGVPLALPLAVIVFFGGLFPIIGAFVSGAFAVMVALATQGWVIALIALGIVVAVQQLESQILAPLVLGRATQLHPLAVIVALTAGGLTLGIVGAFVAVPIVASIARAIGHIRDRPGPTDAAQVLPSR